MIKWANQLNLLKLYKSNEMEVPSWVTQYFRERGKNNETMKNPFQLWMGLKLDESNRVKTNKKNANDISVKRGKEKKKTKKKASICMYSGRNESREKTDSKEESMSEQIKLEST